MPVHQATDRYSVLVADIIARTFLNVTIVGDLEARYRAGHFAGST